MSIYLTTEDLKAWVQDITQETRDRTMQKVKTQSIKSSPHNLEDFADYALYQEASSKAYDLAEDKEKFGSDNIIDMLERYYDASENDNYHIYLLDRIAFKHCQQIAFITGIPFVELFNRVHWFHTRDNSWGVFTTSHDLFDPQLTTFRSLQAGMDMYNFLFGYRVADVALFHQLTYLMKYPTRLHILYEAKQGLRQLQQSKQLLTMHSIVQGQYIKYRVVNADMAMQALQEDILDNDLFPYGAQDNPEHITFKTKDMMEKRFNTISYHDVVPSYLSIEHIN